MTMRQMLLPSGWYPRDAEGLARAFRDYEMDFGAGHGRIAARAALAPHAGWTYSGTYAYAAFRSLEKGADSLIVFGGHRPAGSTVLAASEDGFDGPLGTLAADRELRDAVAAMVRLEEDRYRDNTVEVLLPFAKRFFPEARLLWLRVPNDESSEGLGALVAETAMALGRKAVAVGSTDLTHYGPGYGFCPKGRGPEALEWVRGVNDKAIVDAFLGMDAPSALFLGEARQAACSAGAAAAAIGFAKALGRNKATLLGYGTSAEAGIEENPEQFVGYCAVAYSA